MTMSRAGLPIGAPTAGRRDWQLQPDEDCDDQKVVRVSTSVAVSIGLVFSVKGYFGESG